MFLSVTVEYGVTCAQCGCVLDAREVNDGIVVMPCRVCVLTAVRTALDVALGAPVVATCCERGLGV